jgi:hypothetical protein
MGLNLGSSLDLVRFFRSGSGIVSKLIKSYINYTSNPVGNCSMRPFRKKNEQALVKI